MPREYTDKVRSECCTNPDNFVLRPYTDGTAELYCKKCGYVIRAFDAPKEEK